MLTTADVRIDLSANTSLSPESAQLDSHVNVLACDLNTGLGAGATIVAIIKDDVVSIVGADRPVDISDEAIWALSDVSPTDLGRFTRSAFQWHRSVVEDRPADIFVAPVHRSVDDGYIFVASLFDVQINEKMRAVEAKFDQRRALLTSYLEIWQTGRRRGQREGALEMALSSMRTGVVLLDEQSNVVFANAVADRMFMKADCIKLHRGRLLTTSLRDNVRLNVALQHVSTLLDAHGHDQRAPLLALERSDGTSLVLLALPLGAPASGRGDAITILHIVDPKIDFADHVRPLCRMYRLSRTETDLACLLARGVTLAHAAEIMRLKEQTARSTLRSIFYKTGTGRQTELVLLLLSRVVPTSSTLKIESF